MKIKQNGPIYPEIIFKKIKSFTFWRNTQLKIKFLKKCNFANTLRDAAFDPKKIYLVSGFKIH